MSGRILILAKTPREAGNFATLMGFPVGRYRAVQKASSISGIRNAEVYLLTTFLERHDRHGIMAALRAARYIEVFYVDPADLAKERTELFAAAVDALPAPESKGESVELTVAQFKAPEKPKATPKSRVNITVAQGPDTNYFG